MGQKVSPHGLRVGIISDWDSKWYADKKDFANYLIEDNQIRDFIKHKLYAAGISKTVIERKADNQIKVSVMTDKPGIIIGRSGDGVDSIRAALEKMTKKKVRLNIIEVKRAEMDAQLTAESIAQALEKRVSFRRAMKQAIGRTMRAGAKGMKVCVAGRLGGAEIARSEKYSEGNVPLHTLRANIAYGFAEADTQYGKIGVKVWINLGERLEKGLMSPIPEDRFEKGQRGEGRGRGRGERSDRGDRGERRDRDGGGDRPRRDRREGGGGRGGRDGAPEPVRAVNPRKRVTPKKEAAPKKEAPVKEVMPEAVTEEIVQETTAALSQDSVTSQAETTAEE